MSEPRFAFHDMSPADFPMTIQLVDEDTGEVLFFEAVTGPGFIRIPGFAPRRVAAYLTTPRHRILCDADGRTTLYPAVPDPNITCPQCGMTSHHPQAVKHRYCGNCHQFHDSMELP